MADNILKEKRTKFINSVDGGTINGLLDEVLEKRVLSQEEMDRIKLGNVTVKDKARDLCDSVTKMGPQACQIFITYICKEAPYVAQMMELKSETKRDQSKEDAFPGPRGGLKFCPTETFRKIWKENPSEIYPIMTTSSSRTRLALIICNTDFEHLPRRNGADVDLKKMTLLLKSLDYTVKVKENLTAEEMTTEVKKFAACPEHKTSDSTFLVFMSHGTLEGICGKTYSPFDKGAKGSPAEPDVLKADKIFQMMNTLACPNLKDKPKVIIIQACRGENQGVVFVKDSVGNSEEKFLMDEDFEDDGIKKAHIEKDFIAFFSSTPENISRRHPDQGSLFIVELIKHMEKYAWSCDLVDIFRKVQFAFDQPQVIKQMPTIERMTLTKRFYLFPGH
ncbi:LOW QUALITY PROTEIN: caspase-1-like [Acomys russatus]|uniref:LOW QUALITY PROTEIN: caspase-1-like n=1 Tax=Acomys russatus TaxID=60746 RepID=UPI0021E30283|nr:LOW QUALITY PROTEIN: caspase-1-like [Acomys russatus]